MKVICIINNNYFLTNGKIYYVINSSHNHFLIKCDIDDIILSFPSSNFMKLEDYRKQQISKILNHV